MVIYVSVIEIVSDTFVVQQWSFGNGIFVAEYTDKRTLIRIFKRSHYIRGLLPTISCS